jgi:hypothetical protein
VEAANNPDVKTYLDYKELINDPKVEAVVIAAPDHWHEQMLIEASNAGKAVYCEKGWTISIAAAKRMRPPGAAVSRLGRRRQDDPRGKARPGDLRQNRPVL